MRFGKWGLLAFVLLFTFRIFANEAEESLCLKDLDDDQQDNISILFQSINQYRIARELPPFVLNNDLCIAANEHAIDISIRGSTNFPLAQRSDGTYVRDWLVNRNFPAYRDGIIARSDVFATGSYTPDTIMGYLGEHRTEILEFTHRQYRELGIAYRYNIDNDTHYYVFISASRPGVLPLTIASADEPALAATTTQEREVILWINNEYNPVQGLNGMIGSLRYIRIGETLPDPNFSCEQVESEIDGWRLFSSSRVRYQLELGVDIHTVYVQMCDPIQTGHYEEAQIYLISDNMALAEFSVSPEGGIAPITLQFQNQSINALSYEWDFDSDGIPDNNEENPSFTFQNPGFQTITLTAYGQEGTEPSSYSLQVQIDAPEVLAEPLEAVIRAEADADNPLAYRFHGRDSTGAIESYVWDFENNNDGDATGDEVSFIYPAAGTYEVKLTVRSAAGTVDEVVETITINPPACIPQARIEASTQTGFAPLNINLLAVSESDCPILTYEWDLSSDGIIDRGEANPAVTYNELGEFVLSLTVTGESGQGSSSQITISVLPNEPSPEPSATATLPPPSPTSAPPVAHIQASTTSGQAPLSVNLTSQSEGEITELQWESNGDDLPDSFEETLSLDFNNPGSYLILLKAIGPGGVSITYVQIDVTAPQIPTATSQAARAEFTMSATQLEINQELRLSNNSSGADNFLWDFNGDGLTDSIEVNPSYRYQIAGEYEIRLIVIGAGGTDIAIQRISVSGGTENITNTPSPTPPIPASDTPSPTPTATTVLTPAPSPTVPTNTPSPSPTFTATATNTPPPTSTNTPPPTPTPLRANIHFEIHSDSSGLILVNRNLDALSVNDLESLNLISSGGSITGARWHEGWPGLTQLDNGDCVLLFDPNRDYTDLFNASGCFDLESNQDESPFWLNGFSIAYRGVQVRDCQLSVPCVVDLTQGYGLPQPEAGTQANPTATPTTAPSQTNGDIRLYWEGDFIIIQNTSGREIPSGQWIQLGFGRGDELVYPNSLDFWTEYRNFERVRSSECIILENKDTVNFYSFDSAVISIGCSRIVTNMTTSLFWQNSFDVFFNNQQIASCSSGSSGECYADLP